MYIHLSLTDLHSADIEQWEHVPVSDECFGPDSMWTRWFNPVRGGLMILLPPLTLAMKQYWEHFQCENFIVQISTVIIFVMVGIILAMLLSFFSHFSGKVPPPVWIGNDPSEQYLIFVVDKEHINSLSVRVYLKLTYLCLSLSLLKRRLHCSASLVCRKCREKTVAESVASAKAVLLCLSGRTALRVVMMIVFVTQMLLMMAGDVEPNPGPGEWEGGGGGEGE